MPHTPAQKRALREARKVAGLCYFCPQLAIPGQVRCVAHRDEAAETREFRKVSGLCAKCANASLPGKLHCAACMEAGRRTASQQRSERSGKGLCVQCSSPAKPGCTACVTHSAVRVATARAATLRLRARSREELLTDRDRLHLDGLKNCRQRGAHDGPLPLNRFGINADRPDGLQQNCRDCRGLAYRRHAVAYWRAQGIPFACVYCGGPFEHVDHVIPTSRGGTHDVTNLVPACTSCNTSKGDKLLDEWLALRGVY